MLMYNGKKHFRIIIAMLACLVACAFCGMAMAEERRVDVAQVTEPVVIAQDETVVLYGSADHGVDVKANGACTLVLDGVSIAADGDYGVDTNGGETTADVTVVLRGDSTIHQTDSANSSTVYNALQFWNGMSSARITSSSGGTLTLEGEGALWTGTCGLTIDGDAQISTHARDVSIFIMEEFVIGGNAKVHADSETSRAFNAASPVTIQDNAQLNARTQSEEYTLTASQVQLGTGLAGMESADGAEWTDFAGGDVSGKYLCVGKPATLVCYAAGADAQAQETSVVLGQPVTVKAGTKAYHNFAGWYENDVLVSQESEYSFEITGNRTLTAAFEPEKYMISAAAEPAEGGSVMGAGEYTYQTEVTLSAQTAEDYDFVGWYEGDVLISTEPACSFPAETARSLSARFALKTFQINAFSSDANGGTVSGSGTFAIHTDVTVTAQAAENYTFAGWYENDVLVSEEAAYTFALERSLDLYARFEPIMHVVSLIADPEEFGTVSGAGEYQQGTAITVTAYPNDGCSFAGWYENGELLSDLTQYSFTVEGERTLTAAFEEIVCIVETPVDPSKGGTVIGAGEYEYGQTVTLTAEPAEGYEFEGWYLGDEIELGNANPISFEVYDSFSSYQARFTARQYKISIATNDASGGLVVGGGTFAHGTDVTVRATAESYYTFKGWYEEDVLLSTENEYTFPAERDCTVTAIFEPVTYTITASADPAEGGTVTGGGTFARNAKVNLMAQTNPGYTFNGWYKGSTLLTNYPGYGFTALADGDYTAKYTLNTYRVYVSASPSLGGSVTGAGTYTYGQEAVLTAQPVHGYRFAGWYEGDVLLSTEASYTVRVEEQHSVTAKFELTDIVDGDFIVRRRSTTDSSMIITGYTGSGTEVTVPGASSSYTVTAIGPDVFAGKGITRINLPDSLTALDENTFALCDAEIYATANTYVSQALAQMGLFHHDEAIADFVVNTPVKGYGSSAVVKALYTGSRTAKSVTIPMPITELADDCFAGMTALETVYYDNYYTYLIIGDRAFKGCTALKRVDDNNRYGTGDVGESAFEGCKSLITLEVGNGKAIGANAFKGCVSLGSLFLSDNISTIGEGAFDSCPAAFYCTAGSTTAATLSAMGKSGAPLSAPGLTFTNYSDSGWTVTKFDGSVTDVVIPEGVETISNGVFREKNITSVKLPQTLKTIKSTAFYDCIGLTSIDLPEGLETIGSNAFGYCTNLTSVEIPASVKTIDSSAFYKCLSLQSVTLHEGLETIGSSAFADTALSSVTLPSSLKVLKNAFSSTGITEVHLPENMTSCYTDSDIRFFVSRDSATAHAMADKPNNGVDPFADPEWPEYDLCYVINEYTGEHELNIFKYHGTTDVSVTVPDGVKAIYKSAFYPNSYEGNTVIETIILPDSVVSIGSNAFRGMPNLKKIYLPDNIVSFGSIIVDSNTCSAQLICSKDSTTARGITASVYEGGFTDPAHPDWSWYYEGDSLGVARYNGTAVNVSVPEGAVAIGAWAFKNCNSVQEITVPDSVKSIGNYAFNRAAKLKNVYLPDDVTTLGIGLLESESTAVLLCQLESATARLITARVNYGGFADPEEPDCSLRYTGDDLILTRYRGTQPEVILPEGIVAIESKAFYECKTLEKIVLPEGLTEIRDHAFQYCAKLSDITFPSTLERVESGAFNMAACALKKLDFSATSLNYLGGNSLLCSLEEVWLPDNVTTVETYPMYDTCLIFCKKGSVTAYNVSAESDSYRLCDPADPDWRWRYNDEGELLFGGYRGTQTEITLPDYFVGLSDYAFSGNTTLKKVVIPESVTSLGYASINDSIQELYLPDNITDINANAISYWYGSSVMYVSRDSVTFDNLCGLGEAFNFCDPADPDWMWRYEEDGRLLLAGYRGTDAHITLPDDAVGVHNSFDNNTLNKQNIVRVDMPQSITFIDYNSFLNFANLKEVHLPDNVTMDDYPFEWMRYGEGPVLYCNMDSDTAKNLYKGHEEYCFCDPSDPDWLWRYDENGTLMLAGYLGDERIITLPEGATAVASNAFWKGDGLEEEEALESITIPEGYTAIGDYAFDDECQYLKHISLPSTLKSIGQYAFWACDFGMIQLPEGLEAIGLKAFSACGLQSLTIPTTVTSIPEPIVWTCHDLTTVVLHSGLQYIADDAFGEHLTDVYCYRGSYAAQWAKEQVKTPALALHYIDGTTFDKNLTIMGPNPDDPDTFARDAGTTRVWMEGVSLPLLKPDETYTFTCTSSNPSVARIVGDTVEYLKPGKVTLTISLEGHSNVKPCTINQEVFAPVESFTVPDVVFAQLGKDGRAEAYAPIEVYPANANPWFDWEKIENGKLWVDSSEEPEIRRVEITSRSGVTREILVVFYHQFEGLEAYAPGRELLVGEIYDPDITLTVDGSPLGNLNMYTITSSNPAVAAAVDGHRIKAMGRGTATITVKEDTSGLKTSFTVKVDVRDALITPRFLTVIGPEAFAGIAAKEIILYSECTEIQSRAFAECQNLRRIEIPASVKTIADDAFAGCSSDLVIAAPSYSEARKFADAHGFVWEDLAQ